jgi:DNA-dependent RNA polymerase auxiliary subunit epsilon
MVENLTKQLEKYNEEEPKNWLAIIYQEDNDDLPKSWSQDSWYREFNTEVEVDNIISEIERSGLYNNRPVKSVTKWSLSQAKEIERAKAMNN